MPPLVLVLTPPHARADFLGLDGVEGSAYSDDDLESRSELSGGGTLGGGLGGRKIKIQIRGKDEVAPSPLGGSGGGGTWGQQQRAQRGSPEAHARASSRGGEDQWRGDFCGEGGVGEGGGAGGRGSGAGLKGWWGSGAGLKGWWGSVQG